MTAVRNCRACGCTDVFACPGGCSWIAADRCSACPPERPSIHPINAEHVRNSRFTLQMALSLSGGGRLRRHVGFDYPALTIQDVVTRGEPDQRQIYVDGEEMDWNDLGAVADRLNQRLRSVA